MHVLKRSHLTNFLSALNRWFRCLRHLAMNTATETSSLHSTYKSRFLLGSSQFQIAAQELMHFCDSFLRSTLIIWYYSTLTLP